jgi:hypothetical protein
MSTLDQATDYSPAVLGYFAAHGIDPGVAASAGVTANDRRVAYPYVDADGRYERVRVLDGDAKTQQPRGRQLCPWWPAGTPDEPETVLVCEGESDALSALTAIRAASGVAEGILAGVKVVGVPGATFPAERLAGELQARGVQVALLASDMDAAGEQFAERSAAALRAAGIRSARVPLRAGSDLAESLAAADDPADWLAGVIADLDSATTIMSQACDLIGDDWPELGARELPAFPVDALPADVEAWVYAVAEESQTPPDLAAMAALGVLSAAAMGGPVIDCGTWTEELPLYLLTAMPSGDRKSTVLRAAVAPLRELEREQADAALPQINELRTRRDVLEVRRRKLVKTAGEATDSDARKTAEAELAEADQQLAEIGEPVVPRRCADDLTPEALGGLLAQHGKIAVIAAESAFLDNLSGRYSENGANLHLICAAYHGEQTMIDRRNRDPEILARPLVSVSLAVQPHVLGNLIEHPIARAQGLVSRFAYSMPTTQLGTRRIDAPQVAPEIHAAWATTVRLVADRTDTNGNPGICVGIVSVSQETIFKLPLSPKASELLHELRAEQEPRLAPSGDLRPIADWAARHAGRVARIAGLLHLAQVPAPGNEISVGTMLRALAIGDYLLAHGKAALTGPDTLTQKALQWLTGRSHVTVRDLHRGPMGARGTSEDAAQLADALVEHGALRLVVPDHEASRGRPPSPAYEVHPDFMRHADNADTNRLVAVEL